jgi:hypothetical protein
MTYVLPGSAIYIKQGNLLPIVDQVLYDSAGPVNLASATVNFVAKNPATGSVQINSSCSVLTATAGRVQYNYTTADVSMAAVYNAEFQVSFTGSKYESFPNDGYLKFVVASKLS